MKFLSIIAISSLLISSTLSAKTQQSTSVDVASKTKSEVSASSRVGIRSRITRNQVADHKGSSKTPPKDPKEPKNNSKGKGGEIITCDAGQYYNSVTKTCETIEVTPSCAAGNYLNGSACTPCALGSYSDQPNSSSCTPCALNFYQDEVGQSSCKVCEGGTDNIGSDNCR